MLSGAGASRVCPDRLSVRRKEGSMLDLAGSQRRTWDQDCRCLVVSFFSSSWRTC